MNYITFVNRCDAGYVGLFFVMNRQASLSKGNDQ